MPTYSFKERFVPMVQDYTKRQTVRSYRKDGKLPKPGDMVHLFSGMRTKHCKRLTPKGEDFLLEVQTIFILSDGRVFLTNLQTKENAEGMLNDLPYLEFHCYELTGKKDFFAWLDGFRPKGSTQASPGKAFNLMLEFWRTTNTLPFTGTVAYW